MEQTTCGKCGETVFLQDNLFFDRRITARVDPYAEKETMILTQRSQVVFGSTVQSLRARGKPIVPQVLVRGLVRHDEYCKPKPIEPKATKAEPNVERKLRETERRLRETERRLREVEATIAKPNPPIPPKTRSPRRRIKAKTRREQDCQQCGRLRDTKLKTCRKCLEQQKAIREKRINSGLCFYCGSRPHRPNRRTCDECGKKDYRRKKGGSP